MKKGYRRYGTHLIVFVRGNTHAVHVPDARCFLPREQEVRELLDPDRGGIGGSARSGEAEERLETLAERREELSKVQTCAVLLLPSC